MKNLLSLSLCLILSMAIAGCGSSEESGSLQKAPLSQQTPTTSTPQESAQLQKKQSRQKGSRLTSKQDTLVASVTRRGRSSSRPVSRVERPKNPSYTVQIGIFRKAQNALRYQKFASERFPKNSVHNRYDSKTKMYWVSVGKYTTREEAVALRREILKNYPKEYEKAWVNYIPR